MREVATIRHIVPLRGEEEGRWHKTTKVEGPEGYDMTVTLWGDVLSIKGEGETFYIPIAKLLWMRIELEE